MTRPSNKMAPLPLLLQNGRWTMRFRGKRAEFADRASALQAAVLEAYEHSQNGTPTQVVSVDDELNIEILWTYGVDPNPKEAPAASAADARAGTSTARQLRAAGGS